MAGYVRYDDEVEPQRRMRRSDKRSARDSCAGVLFLGFILAVGFLYLLLYGCAPL